MAVHASHAALPYPVKGARYSALVPYLDADGDPTDPVTPDTEITKDGGALADCAEEVAAVTGAGLALMTWSGAEMDCSVAGVLAKVASGPKPTLMTLYPRVLPVLWSGQATAGAAGSITLPTSVPRSVAKLIGGCIIKTTGGTGGGGTGGANNQARVCTGFTTAGVASVVPDWETAPDNTTTFDVLLTESAMAAWLGLAPAEPTAAPSWTSVFADWWGWIFARSRNKMLQSSTEMTVRNDADSATLGTASLSDVAGTGTRGKFT